MNAPRCRLLGGAIAPPAARCAPAFARVPEDRGGPALAALAEAMAAMRATAARCAREYRRALRLASPALAALALEHANDARVHERRLAGRIEDLGGHADHVAIAEAPANPGDRRPAYALVTAIVDELAMERATIDRLRELSASLADVDAPARRLLDEVIAGENARTADLAALLGRIPVPGAH